MVTDTCNSSTGEMDIGGNLELTSAYLTISKKKYVYTQTHGNIHAHICIYTYIQIKCKFLGLDSRDLD